MYKYWGFGLHIISEIEFPELLPAKFEDADIVIISGKIQPASDTTSITDNEFFLEIRNTCSYEVRDGKYIIFEPYEGIDNRSIRLYILATVMAFILLNKGRIPLHASGILRNNQLILFAGDSGAGKSTTLASLATRGYTIFTDDVCVLQKSENEKEEILGIASYPLIKLWDHSITHLNSQTYRNKNFRIRHDLEKFGYFFHDEFSTRSVPVSKIFILKVSEQFLEISHRKLSGLDAFRELEKQTYRKELINNQKLRSINFNTLSFLSNHCEIIEITRPLSGTLEDLPDRLEHLF